MDESIGSVAMEEVKAAGSPDREISREWLIRIDANVTPTAHPPYPPVNSPTHPEHPPHPEHPEHPPHGGGNHVPDVGSTLLLLGIALGGLGFIRRRI